MKVIKSNVENIESEVVLLYALTKGKKNTVSVSKLEDEELDAEYPVDVYLLYEDLNNKGETVPLLSIMSGERVLTAQSATFQRSFFEILDLVGNRPFSIRVTDGKTKSDRRFMDCELAALL